MVSALGTGVMVNGVWEVVDTAKLIVWTHVWTSQNAIMLPDLHRATVTCLKHVPQRQAADGLGGVKTNRVCKSIFNI